MRAIAREHFQRNVDLLLTDRLGYPKDIDIIPHPTDVMAKNVYEVLAKAPRRKVSRHDDEEVHIIRRRDRRWKAAEQIDVFDLTRFMKKMEDLL